MAEPIQSTLAGVSLITLAVAVFGPQAGPYIVIVLGALGGGLWALSSATLDTRLQGAWLMLRCLVTAIVLTAMIAGLLGPWLGIATLEAYAAVAFCIGALGNKWLEIIDSIKQRIQSVITGGARP
jgi:hypothetical protein